MPSTRPPSVIIVGAGFAGLAAARDLHARGFHVRLVDARARIGGRVHTIRDGFVDGQHGEAGGELIDREHTAAIELAQSLGLRLTRILRKGFGSHLVGPGGRVRHHVSQTTDWKKLANAFSGALEVYRRAGDRHGWDGAVARVLGARSPEQHLEALRTGHGASAKEVAWLCTQVASLHGFFLADGDELSMLMLLDELMAAEDPGARQAFRIDGGNDRLAAAMARTLAKDAILLEREVVAITQTESGVRVSLAATIAAGIPTACSKPATSSSPRPPPRCAASASIRRCRRNSIARSTRCRTASRRRRCCSARIRSGAPPIGLAPTARTSTSALCGMARKDNQDARRSSYRSPADRRARRRRSCCARKARKDFSSASLDARESREAREPREPREEDGARTWNGSSGRTRGHRVAFDDVGARSVGGRRLCVFQPVVRSVAAAMAVGARRQNPVRRRAYEPGVAGLHERRGHHGTTRRDGSARAGGKVRI